MYPIQQRAVITRPRKQTPQNDNEPCLYSIIRSPHPDGTALTLYEARQQTKDWHEIKQVVLETEFDAAAALRVIRMHGVDCLL